MSRIAHITVAGGASALIGNLATTFLAPDWTIEGTVIAGAAGAITAGSRQLLLEVLERQISKSSHRLQRTLVSDFRHSTIGTCAQASAARARLIKSFSSRVGNLYPLSLKRDFITLRGDEANGLMKDTICLAHCLRERSPGLDPEITVRYPAIAPAIDITIDAMNRRLSDSGVTIVKDFHQSTSKDGANEQCDFAFMAVDAPYYRTNNRLRMVVPVYESPCAVLRDKRPIQGMTKTIILNESASLSHRHIAFQRGEIANGAVNDQVECSDDFIAKSMVTDPGDLVFAWEAIGSKLLKQNPNLARCKDITRYPRTVCLFADKSWCGVHRARSEALQAFVNIFSFEWNRQSRVISRWFGQRILLSNEHARLEIARAFERAVS
jgi:hypothetical protein